MYSSFLHDVGGRVIKTLGLRYEISVIAYVILCPL